MSHTGQTQVNPQRSMWKMQKIPHVSRIDVDETLCPQQMLVHKGDKIKNWGGECRDVTPTTKLQSQNIWGGGGRFGVGGGSVWCGGGGGGGGVGRGSGWM